MRVFGSLVWRLAVLISFAAHYAIKRAAPNRDKTSFRFGLPAPEAVLALKAAGIVLISTTTTVVEDRVLERAGWVP